MNNENKLVECEKCGSKMRKLDNPGRAVSDEYIMSTDTASTSATPHYTITGHPGSHENQEEYKHNSKNEADIEVAQFECPECGHKCQIIVN